MYIGWYEFVPGVCIYLYEIIGCTDYNKAVIALQVDEQVSLHTLKIYHNSKGSGYVVTKWGRFYLSKFNTIHGLSEVNNGIS